MDTNTKTPQEVKDLEQRMFEDFFKGMPFEEFKKTAIESINNCKDYNKLANSCYSLLKVCVLNTNL